MYSFRTFVRSLSPFAFDPSSPFQTSSHPRAHRNGLIVLVSPFLLVRSVLVYNSLAWPRRGYLSIEPMQSRVPSFPLSSARVPSPQVILYARYKDLSHAVGAARAHRGLLHHVLSCLTLVSGRVINNRQIRYHRPLHRSPPNPGESLWFYLYPSITELSRRLSVFDTFLCSTFVGQLLDSLLLF